jgi:CHAT domain-containing protein
MLLVVEDCASVRDMPTLYNAKEEIVQIAEIAKASQCKHVLSAVGTQASVKRVSASIVSANFVHFACHGIQDRADALESSFVLNGGHLTMNALIRLNTNKAWFAYLSACETAKGDAKQPDQAVHLAASMLFAGFKSVVATMW